MNKRLNVKRCGAVGDGKTDDTRELVRDLGGHEDLLLTHQPGSLLE